MATSSGSALIHSDARARLRAAAEAAGLTVEQLVNLVHDSGAVLSPPKDGFTERYTLEDLGVRMRTILSKVPVPDRPQWFQGLVDTQKAALITTLRIRGYSSDTIAQDFEIDPLEVQRTYNRHADRLGAQVVNVRLDTIAGQLQLAAERAAEGARNKDDWASFWRIHKEMLKCLQDLGIVDKAVHKVEVTHSFDEQHRTEIDRMLDLERKQRKRLEEIKQVDAEVIATDELPEMEELPTTSMQRKYEGD